MLETLLVLLVGLVAGMWFSRQFNGRPLPASSDEARGEAPAKEPLRRGKIHADVAGKADDARHAVPHGEEADLCRLLEGRVQGRWKRIKPVRGLAQVNMAGFIQVVKARGGAGLHELARRAVNSKPVDILLTCHHFHPRVALAYQGRFHREDEGTMLRDEVRRAALEKTGDACMPRIHHALKRHYPKAFA